MQNAQKLNILNQKYPQLKNIKNSIPVLEKVKEQSPSNFSLLKRFLKELQLSNNFSLTMYNREVI